MCACCHLFPPAPVWRIMLIHKAAFESCRARVQAIALQGQAACGPSVHVMLPLYAGSDQQALVILSRVFQAPSWREVSLVDLQTLQGMYRGGSAPSISVLRRPRVRDRKDLWRGAFVVLSVWVGCMTLVASLLVCLNLLYKDRTFGSTSTRSAWIFPCPQQTHGMSGEGEGVSLVICNGAQ
jgi:hypothetical protein